MIKMIGSLLILISGSSIGWILANKYLQRIQELKELQLAFNILSSEIAYGRTLLPRALKLTGGTISYPLAGIFENAGSELKKSRTGNFAELWENIIKTYMSKSYLKSEDIDILLNWGCQVGSSDLENQINIINITIKRLQQNEKLAKEAAEKRVKPMRYAGVLLSLMVIILFL
ncbi:MAG: hypothetical protein ACOCQW_00085 [Halanaerobiaceae bacterium]